MNEGPEALLVAGEGASGEGGLAAVKAEKEPGPAVEVDAMGGEWVITGGGREEAIDPNEPIPFGTVLGETFDPLDVKGSGSVGETTEIEAIGTAAEVGTTSKLTPRAGEPRKSVLGRASSCLRRHTLCFNRLIQSTLERRASR